MLSIKLDNFIILAAKVFKVFFCETPILILLSLFKESNTDILESYQKSEVSEMKWFSLDECKQHIRDYNIEKIDMICKINSLLEKYKLIT